MGYFEDVKKWKNYHSADSAELSHLKIVIDNVTKGAAFTFKYKSLNIGKRTGEIIRDLVWGENPDITLSNAKDTNKDKIKGEDFIVSVNKVLSDSKFNSMMHQYIECMVTEGGFFIKTVLVKSDDDKLERIELHFYTPEDAEPVEWTNNTMTSVNFYQYKDIMYRGSINKAKIIENHTLNKDTYNVVYTIEVAGETVKPSAIGLEYADFVYDGVTKPLFTYFKSPKAHNKSYDIMYGSSIYSGVEPQLEQIDICYGEILLDMKVNRTIGILSREAAPDMDTLANEKTIGRTFNLDTMYMALNTTSDGILIDPVKRLSSQFNTENIVKGLDTALRLYESSVGLSSGTFTSSGDVAKTATEIVSKESSSYRTKSTFEQNITYGINDLITAIVQLLNYANDTDYGIDNISVKYYDAADQDDSAFINELESSVTAGLRTWKKAIMLFNSCDELQATVLMNEIIAERKLRDGQISETNTK